MFLNECVVPRGTKTRVLGPAELSLPSTTSEMVLSSTKKYSSWSRCRCGGGPSPGSSSAISTEHVPPVWAAPIMTFMSMPKGRIVSASGDRVIRGSIWVVIEASDLRSVFMRADDSGASAFSACIVNPRRLIGGPARAGAFQQRLRVRQCGGAAVSTECGKVFSTEQNLEQPVITLQDVARARVEFVEVLAHPPDEPLQGLRIRSHGSRAAGGRGVVSQHGPQV